MKRIRSNIEPWLMKAGFEFDGKNKVTDSRTAWLGYSRPGLILRCLFEPRKAGFGLSTYIPLVRQPGYLQRSVP